MTRGTFESSSSPCAPGTTTPVDPYGCHVAEWTDEPGELGGTVAASSLSVAYWVAGALPQARGVVTLWRAGRPALAFTYADAEPARELAASSKVGLAFTERRGTGRTFRPMVAAGTPRLVEDPDGALFGADLLDQELRRFPPARLLADSALLRREHWWYLPRLVVELDVESVRLLPNGQAGDHLLVTSAGSGLLEATPARVVEESADTLRLDLDAVPDAGPALLFGQDASFPDLERWSQWRFRGTWDGQAFRVLEAPQRRGLAPVPGILARWRRQRNLERACRQALAAE